MNLKTILCAFATIAMPLVIAAQTLTDPADYIYPKVWYNDNNLSYPLDSIESMTAPQIIDSATAVLTIFPDDIYAIRCRAWANVNMHNHDQAIDDALRILQTANVYDATDIMNYAARKQPVLAIDKIGKFNDTLPIETDVDSTIKYYTLYSLATAYQFNHQPVEAMRIIDKAAQIGNNRTEDVYYDVPLFKSNILMSCGRSKEAVKLLEPYYDGVVENGSIINNLGLALRDSGQTDKALDLFYHAWDDTGDLGFLVDYANLKALTGDYETAFSKFDDIIARIEPDLDPEYYYETSTLAEAYLRKGIYQIANGERQTGKANIRKALLIPSIEGYHGFEAMAYAWLGEREKAFQWYEDVHIEPDIISLCAIHSILGDTDKAAEYLKTAFSQYLLCPDKIQYDPNLRRLIGTPQYKEALKSFKPLLKMNLGGNNIMI